MKLTLEIALDNDYFHTQASVDDAKRMGIDPDRVVSTWMIASVLRANAEALTNRSVTVQAGDSMAINDGYGNTVGWLEIKGFNPDAVARGIAEALTGS